MPRRRPRPVRPRGRAISDAADDVGVARRPLGDERDVTFADAQRQVDILAGEQEWAGGRVGRYRFVADLEPAWPGRDDAHDIDVVRDWPGIAAGRSPDGEFLRATVVEP